MSGQVPYRDVFDHKGIYLYFFYGLCTLVSRTTFAGVYLMEILCGAADLFCLYRILRLYVRRGTAFVLLPPLLAVMFSSRSFYWGGSAEEICLPFLLWPLYLLLRAGRRGGSAAGTAARRVAGEMGTGFRNALRRGAEGDAGKKQETVFTGREALAIGLCAGVVANIKFTLLGFFLAGAILVAFRLIPRRSWRELGQSVLLFLAGAVLATVPWVIYFGAHGALGDWAQGYLVTNLSGYSTLTDGEEALTAGERIKSLLLILYWLIRQNIQYFALVIAGLFWALLRRGADLWERLAPGLLFGFLFLGIYIGGSELPYYSLPLSIFAVLGTAALGRAAERIIGCAAQRMTECSAEGVAGRAVQKVSGREAERTPGRAAERITGCAAQKIAGPRAGRTAFAALGLAVSLTAGLGLCYGLTMNRYYLSYEKEDLFQYRFAGTIRASGVESPTLLNYRCLDAGLFTTADILPSQKWFQAVNIELPEMDEAQRQSILQGETDFVLVRDAYPDTILQQYRRVDEMMQVMGDTVHMYYLFQKK